MKSFTRRELLGSATAFGARTAVGVGLGVGLGLGLGAGCATDPVIVMPQDGHPFAGLKSFQGVPLDPPKLEGMVTVVDFWASWCGPCRQGFRYLDQLYRTYAGRGMQVIAVSLDDTAQAGLGFVARMRPRFDTVWDGDGFVRERFAVSSLPTTLLIDKQGDLVHRHAGFEPRMHKVLESHVRRLLEVL